MGGGGVGVLVRVCWMGRQLGQSATTNKAAADNGFLNLRILSRSHTAIRDTNIDVKIRTTLCP